jgi:uncharacterized membrane protein
VASLTSLVFAFAFWALLHALVAGAWRGPIAARTGENGLRILFSVLSVAGLVGLIRAWGAAPYVELWAPGRVLTLLPLVIMPFACVFLVAALSTPSPTAVGGEGRLKAEAKGIFRVTRHPMLWAFLLWALAHMAANGDAAAWLFFGAIALVALRGMFSIDRKLKARKPEAWAGFARATSLVPFAAILAGRNRLDLGEIGWWRIALGLALFALSGAFHQYLFGARPVPF